MARRSPKSARLEMLKSTPLRRTAPLIAIAMPAQVARFTTSPRARAITAAQAGWVATSATDEETEVYDRLGIQVAKWAPRRSPAPQVRRRTRGLRAAHSRRVPSRAR